MPSPTIIYELPLQPCANSFFEARATDVLLSLNGSRAAFRVPKYPGGPIDDGSALYFQWTDVREHGRAGKRCAPTVHETIFSMPLHLCQCSISSVSTAADGVSRTGFDLTISSCPFPQENLVATASFVYTNVTVVDPHYPTLLDSLVPGFNYTSFAGDWKFGIHVEGWNWNSTAVDSYPNNTYVAAGIQMGFETDKDLHITVVQNILTYRLAAEFGTTTLTMTMDLVLGGATFFGADMPIHFCEPTPTALSTLRHWNTMYNDPTISVVFGDLENTSPISPHAAKSNKTASIATGVVCGIVLLAVICSVLLVMFNDTVRNAVLPHNKRRVEAARSHSKAAGSTSSSWTRSSAPLQS